MQIAHIDHKNFGIMCEEKRKKKKNKIDISMFDFSIVRRITGTLGEYFTLE